MKLHLDFESRSAVDLTKVGAWAYAQHPSTQITCMGVGTNPAWVRVFGGLEHRFDWGKCSIPDIENCFISAHNAAFEYCIYNFILHKRFGWPARWDPKLWTCTMARAAMVGLPLGLDELTRVLKCKTPKDLEGRAIMKKLCAPVEIDPFTDAPVYNENPLLYQRLYAYNKGDVIGEMEVDSLLPELSESERRVWELDLVMNNRGIQIDTDLARAGAKLATQVSGPINDRLRVLTKGEIDKATQNTALKNWFKKQGVPIPTHKAFDAKVMKQVEKETLNKVGVTELLERQDLTPLVREVVLLKRQANKTTSTAKYAKALEMVCSDGRIRGNLQYHGAHTGRWTGRLLQAHNFPQGYGADPDAEPGLEMHEQILAVSLIKAGNPDVINFTYGTEAMTALSDSLRGMIVSAPGKLLISADYNAIEARIVFWLAGEDSALHAYRTGGSPYLDMGEFIYKRKITKKGDPKEYDISKRTVLGCGFGMGWSTWRDNIYIETAKKGKPVRLSDELAKTAVNGYRTKYSQVPRLWAAMEAAAVNAVKNPGKHFTAACGKVLWAMSNDRRFLVCRLPSGRYLWYYKPSVVNAKTPWGEDKETLHYWGVHPKTKEWMLLKTYGGALTENTVQATARDVMVNGMFKVESAGFEMILTVHDELLAECLAIFNPDLNTFMKLMCDLPTWAAGLPVAAEGWVGDRYRK